VRRGAGWKPFEAQDKPATSELADRQHANLGTAVAALI
jgi:hypothetical protein